MLSTPMSAHGPAPAGSVTPLNLHVRSNNIWSEISVELTRTRRSLLFLIPLLRAPCSSSEAPGRDRERDLLASAHAAHTAHARAIHPDCRRPGPPASRRCPGFPSSPRC